MCKILNKSQNSADKQNSLNSEGHDIKPLFLNRNQEFEKVKIKKQAIEV